MKTIPFPSSYKKALLKGVKNTTLRFNNEQGKYKMGEIYEATTYSGKSWETKIQIEKISTTTIDKLSEYEFSERTIHALRKHNLFKNVKVDILRFRLVH